MALKPTIYKFTIMLSDLDRNLFETLNLTVAQHPSETLERMMVRVLAYCDNLHDGIAFGRGLSTADEPDLWVQTLDGRIEHWIDVGEPSPERIKKASRIADRVSIYSFNAKSPVWWQQDGSALSASGARVLQLDWAGVQALAGMVERTLELSLTLTEGSAYFSSDKAECEVNWTVLAG